MAQRDPAANPRTDWSRVEVEATVADYFAMLAKELSGVPYNKAAHRRQLVTSLDGRSTVRELYGVMTATGAVGGFVVTSGTFTKDAQRFADGREIELISVDYLLREVGKDQMAAQEG